MSTTKIALQVLPQIWHEPSSPGRTRSTTSTELRDMDPERDTTRHPLRLRPGGNALTAAQNLYHNIGTFQRLPEEVLQELIEWLDQRDLLALGTTCRAMFAYASNDQLWRDLCIRDPVEQFEWRGSWRSSRLRLPTPLPYSTDCRNLFSDALHRPFFCSQIRLAPYTENIPPHNAIKRFSDLSPESFENSWVDKPFILTDVVNKWPLFKEWSISRLLEKYRNVVFRAEAIDWPMQTYVDYLNDCRDESPLYLFDRAFAEKMRLDIGERGAYWPPECLGHDLFTLLGDQRPDHRWLIIGPERSGSTFHKDPNATSAWNAVIRGSKYWIMFPRSVLPPGVYVSDDQSEVTSPLSIAEWLLTFHVEARKIAGCIEGICHEGEVLHIPSGWWHLVVNLEPAIAITQNFVPDAHLKEAVSFLRNRPEQVSGFATDVSDPYALFLQRLQEQRPDLVHVIDQPNERKRKWEAIVCKDDDISQQPKGFAFGFGDDIADEDD